MSEQPAELNRDIHFTFNDIRSGLNRVGIYQGVPVSMGNEQSGFTLAADMANPYLRECTEDLERAFPTISGNQWIACITDEETRNEAYAMASNGFVTDLGEFIRAQIPRKLATYLDPTDRAAEGIFDLMSLELGEGIRVDIKASGYVWGVGNSIDHEVELRAVFRRSAYTSSSR